MKMPDPTIPPMTSMVASNRPNRRASCGCLESSIWLVAIQGVYNATERQQPAFSNQLRQTANAKIETQAPFRRGGLRMGIAHADEHGFMDARRSEGSESGNAATRIRNHNMRDL